MKKLTGISLCIFLLCGAVFVCWLKPVTSEILSVWSDMAGGRPFNHVLFLAQWVLLFQLAFIAWLAGLTSLEQQMIREHMEAAGINPAVFFTGSTAKAIQANGLAEMQPLAPHEIAGLRHLQQLENGPAVLRDKGWQAELDTAIGRAGCTPVSDEHIPEPTLPVGASSWLVMDIEDAAKFPETGVSLSRSIDQLLSEQEKAVYGPADTFEPVIIKGLNVSGLQIPEADEPEDYRVGGNAFSLTVAFRAEPSHASVPEHMRPAWESKNDVPFYKKVNSLLNE